MTLAQPIVDPFDHVSSGRIQYEISRQVQKLDIITELHATPDLESVIFRKADTVDIQEALMDFPCVRVNEHHVMLRLHELVIFRAGPLAPSFHKSFGFIRIVICSPFRLEDLEGCAVGKKKLAIQVQAFQFFPTRVNRTIASRSRFVWYSRQLQNLRFNSELQVPKLVCCCPIQVRRLLFRSSFFFLLLSQSYRPQVLLRFGSTRYVAEIVPLTMLKFLQIAYFFAMLRS
mmetsp:Transcript_48075/g.98210  ORF Transcript_48075/g.98210 Transcript_48075/m.98210 type:complete len:230 (-) Transcript_48075:190-879(-)